MKEIIFSICCALCAFSAGAQEVAVFTSGQDGYASYRIPAIVQDASGALLAFCEGRVNDSDDFGNIDIVYKISKDGGQTWGPIRVAAGYDALQAGNPAPVVDLLDPRYPKGRIFLFFNTGNNHEGEIRNGKGLREVWYITSVDGGERWSEPTNITKQTHRPLQPQINPEYNFPEDWRTYANTPGHAFQFVAGPHKGRLYVGANHSHKGQKSDNTDWNAHAFFTDDHGASFQLSEDVPFPGSNESMAAQIGPNSVYMTSRNQRMKPRQRIISISHDGGRSWVASNTDPQLPDPVNQGAVLSWKKGRKFILAHINAANETERNDLTLRLSKDGGKTWYFNKVIAHAPPAYKGAFSAYSDIVRMNRKNIGVLYEKNHYKEIVFTVLKVK